MKKRNLLWAVAALSLAACSDPNLTSSSPDNSGSGSGVSSSGSASSGDQTGETYTIRVVETANGASISVDKDSAKEGETVTVTVTTEDGFVVEAVLVNGEAIEVKDGKGTFVMPNRSVTISVTVKADGEVTLSGQISQTLTEEQPGLYVARGIKVSSLSYFSFSVGSTELDMSDIDYTKCFAPIGYGKTGLGELSVEGGATYDFYYDDNADPEDGRCYIKKVKQDSFPDNPDSFNNLFQGYARSESTMNPDGVLSIKYVNKVTGIDYTYQNHTNGSYAEAKDVHDDGKLVGVVDKKIDGDVLSVVNSYLDDKESYYNGNYERYSGKYGIVDTSAEIGPGLTRFMRTSAKAEFEAHNFAHNYEALYFDLMYAYYTGYDTTPDIGTDGLGLFERNIVSTPTADGFNVSIDSYREIDTSNDVLIEEEYRERNFYTYDADLSFDSLGRVLSIDYEARVYDDVAYSFDSHQIVIPDDFTLESDLTCTYTYGEATTPNTHDDSAFFTKKMAVEVRDDDLGDEYAGKNAIQVSNFDGDAAVNEHMTMTSDVATSLDMENFTIIKSSDTTIVGPRGPLEPYTFIPYKGGTVTLTIGNPAVPSVPQTEIELEVVDNVQVRGFYLTGEDGPYSPGQNLLSSSTSFGLETGTARTFRLIGSPFDVIVPATATSQNESVLTAETYKGDDGYYYLHVEAIGGVTSPTSVAVVINSDRYLDDWKDNPTKIYVTVYPASDFSPIGTWYYIDSYTTDNVASAVDKEIVANIKEYDGTDATISTVTDGEGHTYKFTFNIDEETGIYQYGSVEGGNVAYVQIAETVDGYLGLALQADDGSWTGEDEATSGTIVFGNITFDEENQIVVEQYSGFAPAADFAD